MEEQGFNSSKWGEYGKCYDALNYLGPYNELMDAVIARLNLGQEERFLDAACGTGNLERRLVEERKIRGALVYGLDFSEEMLAIARKKCFYTIIRFMQADLSAPLGFDNDFFDKIASVNTVYALPDPGKTVAEFFRVLKPGGRLVLATPKQGYENGLILKAHCRSSEPDELWCNGHASSAKEEELIRKAIELEDLIPEFLTLAYYNRQIAKNSKFIFFTEQELFSLLENCGFIDIELSEVYARQGILAVCRKTRRLG